jgi:dTDP-4-amino-4,6-dideoxygalactose transaminase
MIGTRYAVATNSCGSALYLALLGSGVRHGDAVLMSAFTLAPVLGAIANAGARAVPVEITPDLVLDTDDLAAKAEASGARHLLVSHMRGHICDLDRLSALCDRLGLALVEDCAHTLGAAWAGRPTGAFGIAGCFSFQSAKHVNAGEGGILATSDTDLAARAILHSGSYMLYRQNGTCPPDEVMDRWRDRCANFSLRLSELAAELALAQLAEVPARAEDWNASHDRIAAGLSAVEGVALPHRPPEEGYVQSSVQFRLPGLAPAQMAGFVAACRARGLFLKWFGAAEAEGFTSAPRHWAGLPGAPAAPRTQAILDTLCDFRLPLGLAAADCDRIVATVAEARAAVAAGATA